MNNYRFNLHFDGERYPPDKWRCSMGADAMDAITQTKEFAELKPACVGIQLGAALHPNGAPVCIRHLTLEYGKAPANE